MEIRMMDQARQLLGSSSIRQRKYGMKSSEKEIGMKIIGKLLLIIFVIIVIGGSQIERDVQNNNLTITGSGNLVSKEVSLSTFDQVEAGLYFDLTIRQGAEPSVVLTTDDNFVEYIQVEQTGSGISFGFKPGYAYDTSGVTLRAEVILPELSRLDLNGSSHARLDGYQSQQPLKITLTGSSSLTGDIQAEITSVEAFGSSYVKLSGTSTNLTLEACGSNIVDLSDYTVEDAVVQASCDSTVIVDVPGRMEGEASQHAQVFFAGSPAVNHIEVNEFASVQPK
jgi:hypothetical protein